LGAGETAAEWTSIFATKIDVCLAAVSSAPDIRPVKWTLLIFGLKNDDFNNQIIMIP